MAMCLDRQCKWQCVSIGASELYPYLLEHCAASLDRLLLECNARPPQHSQT